VVGCFRDAVRDVHVTCLSPSDMHTRYACTCSCRCMVLRCWWPGTMSAALPSSCHKAGLRSRTARAGSGRGAQPS
jgi:hypothetical protein